MRFKKQFEYHKIPEWDEFYFPYEDYLIKIENILKKTHNYKLERVNGDKFNLSESFNIIEDEKETEGVPHQSPRVDEKSKSEYIKKPPPITQDDSLGVEYDSSPELIDMEQPLLSLATDVKELIDCYIQDGKHIDEFYVREKNRILVNFDRFYQKFVDKVNRETNWLNLEDDLKEHGLDGLGYASSWARQFIDFYSKFSWLDGFAKINLVAMQKILLKFDNLIFDHKGGTMYQKVNDFIKSLIVSDESGGREERRKVRSRFAEHYFNSNDEKAYFFLEASVSQYKSSDSSTLIFLFGMVVALFGVILFVLVTPLKPNAYKIIEVIEIIPIYRFVLCIIFTILCGGVVIEYLKEFRVNYVIIFESNPANRLNPSGMYILSAILMIIWLFCLIGQIMTIKDYISPEPHFFAIIMLIVFGIIFFIPLPYFQSFIRFPIIVASINGGFSPFSEVRFLEFFIGDVLTSLTKPFIDVALILCWLNTDATIQQSGGECYPRMFWAIFAWYWPFHIRFWQGINKYFVTGDAFPHLVNAGKYLASIVMIISNYYYGLDPVLKPYVIFLSLFATSYSYVWDILMDWGLGRDSRLLRPQILYPPKYYYFGIITNLFLRFAWTVPFFGKDIWPKVFNDADALTLILCLAEIYRRAQWSLFRLENENINNYEKYRTVLEIPRLPKEK